MLGVTVGCLLGMLPLLWMDPEKRGAEKAKELLADRHDPLSGKTANECCCSAHATALDV